MFIFRGQRIDNKEWIEGDYFCFPQDNHYIISPETKAFAYTVNKQDGLVGYFRVAPESLSISTGQLDKNEKMIFGSFEINGVITKGGDRVKYASFYIGDGMYPDGVDNVYFDNGCFFGGNGELCSEEIHNKQIEVIGQQCELEAK